MTDEEEKRLRQALLAVEFNLRRKQEFWETPRNLAILVGVTAVIAAAVGFWLGRESTTPAPLVRPIVAIGDFSSMRPDQFIDIVQTLGILVIALVVVYVAVRLDRALTVAAKKLKGTLGDQRDLHINNERAWRKLAALEATINTTRAGITSMHMRMDEIEARGRMHENPPDDH
jgi:hypothetical protein